MLKHFVINNTDSGRPLTRKFCSECGSYLFATTPVNEDIVSVAAGSMDNVSEWKPSMELHHRNRAAWVPELAAVDRHVTHPESESPTSMSSPTFEQANVLDS